MINRSEFSSYIFIFWFLFSYMQNRIERGRLRDRKTEKQRESDRENITANSFDREMRSTFGGDADRK